MVMNSFLIPIPNMQFSTWLLLRQNVKILLYTYGKLNGRKTFQ